MWYTIVKGPSSDVEEWTVKRARVKTERPVRSWPSWSRRYCSGLD